MTSAQPKLDLSPEGSLPSRREMLRFVGAIGIGSTVFQRALAVQAEQGAKLTPEMIQQAEWIAGLKLSDNDRKALVSALGDAQKNFAAMRAVKMPNGVPLALAFNPAPWLPANTETNRGIVEPAHHDALNRPDKEEDLAFLPVTALSALVRTRQVSSVELTKLYLDRLHKYDPVLRCVVSFTAETAMKQAEQADREIAAGRYRGVLHGIPWGAKDLIAFPGYRTTWGAAPFKDQVIDQKATVIRRLEDAGAVLVAKLTLGALAMGDRWFGGMTRNPWNPRLGSSGSSAGSACTAAAGLVGFALGSETLGSIVSPCRQCGATGLRPTFGRVSRYGCMTLAWSMDKIGPITRSVEDCALVFGAIHGFDGFDPSAVDRPYSWPSRRDLRSLRVGYVEGRTPAKDRAELTVPVGALLIILGTEAATAFDEVTRLGITEGLNTWPRTFRQGQFVPAVEYLRANRLRSILMRDMETVMSQVDVYVGGNDLLITNLTGHPTVVMPNEFRKNGDFETPLAMTFTGRLYGETELLAVANAYQQATGHHLRRPPMERLTPEIADPPPPKK
jgi:Asp-tRNA(Asn)/Glu-tRNA(Gln) amidotransferase A subunit family amidase